MMRSFLAVLALCALAGCTPSRLYCDPLMMTAELDGTLRVNVPPGQADQFNQRVVAFLDSQGFSYESSASDTWLTPPDAAGRQTAYRNIKTIGCTSKAIIWSENSIQANQFLVTFHHTAFGNSTSSAKLMADLTETARLTPSR
jgi:hypothetical protein